MGGAVRPVPASGISTAVNWCHSLSIAQFIVELETTPWDLDSFTFDRFEVLQGSTTITTQLGFYNVVFSKVSYVGSTAVPEPVAIWSEVGFAAVVLGWNQLKRN